MPVLGLQRQIDDEHDCGGQMGNTGAAAAA